MQLVERIKAIAARQGLTLSQLEQHLGFGVHTIYKWDKNSPSVEKVLAVANFLQVPLAWLVTGQYDTSIVPDSFLHQYGMLSDSDKEKINHFMEICLSGYPESYTQQSRNLPILGYVSAEVPAEGVHLLGYTQSDADADYALIMGDNSMKPVLYQKDYIFLKNTQSLASGDIGVFCQERQLLCRQFLTYNNLVELRPFNPQFSAEKYSEETFRTVGVTGKVMLTPRQEDLFSVFFRPKI